MTSPHAIARIDTDLLIGGAGGAGLCAALHAAERTPRATNQATVARLLAQSALERRESRGSHFPQPDSAQLVNVYLQRDGGGSSKVWTLPVRFSRVRPDGPPIAAAE